MRSDTKQWWPALDGLRGVAVLAVLLYHQDVDWLPGGFLGVSLFFTLSGFLITNLVLSDHASSGRVRLKKFWARRVRRLVPVALLGLVVALGVTLATVASDRISETARDIDFAALNVANWRFITRSVTYADALSAPSPVLHYWSLAIEEQFYLVFPLIAALALRRGRQCFAWIMGAVVVLSLARQLMVHDFNRIYLGTDTRAAELAIGCLAALAWTTWGHRVNRRAIDWLGIAAAIALVVTWAEVALDTDALYRGGLVVHALLSALLIFAAIGGRLVTRVFSVSPLRALGRISYGIYVLHFPLFLYLTSERTHIDSGVALFVARLAATLAAAALAHWLVEAPVRWGGALPNWQGGFAAVAGVVAVAVLAAGVVEVNRPAEIQRANSIPVVRMGVDATSAADPTALVSGADPSAAAAAQTPIAVASPDNAAQGQNTPQAAVPRLLVVGDSTGVANGKGLQQWAATSHAAVVDVVADFGCTFFLDGTIHMRDGWDLPPHGTCAHLIDDAVNAANDVKPDAIVVFIGSIQLADWKLTGESTTRSLGDPLFDSRYALAANDALSRLESVGVPVLLGDVPVPDWVPTEQRPGSGPLTMNSVERTDLLNQLNTGIVAAHQDVRLLPYAEHLERPDRTVDPALRPDGLHLSLDAVGQITDAWLLDDLIAAYRSVVAAIPSAELRATTWTPV